MKTPAKSPKAAAKSGALPPGAHTAVGSAAYRKMQGAVRPAPKIVDAHEFTKDPRGGPELRVGKAHFEVRDNRTRTTR